MADSTSVNPDSVADIVIKKEETDLNKVRKKRKRGKLCHGSNDSGSSEKLRFEKYLCSDLKFHPYKCVKCYACFREENLFECHKKDDSCSKSPKHQLKYIEKPTYPCLTCGITFPTLLKRNAHIKTHIKRCAICGLNFETNSELFDHTAEVHLNLGARSKKLQPTERNEEKTSSLKDPDSSINQEGCIQNTKTDPTVSVDHIKGEKAIEKVNGGTINAEDKKNFTHTVKGEHVSLGESPEFTCASNSNKVSVNTEEIPLMNNATNNSIDVVAKIEHAFNIMMGNILPPQLSAEVQNDDFSAIRKMLMEIQSKGSLPLSNDDTTDDSSDVDPLSITESLDNSNTPALHFNNYLHVNWLIDFINALKFTCYPLKDITVEKLTHINMSILQQLPEPTGILCMKENYMCLVEAQKQLSEFLQNHFRCVGGLMS